MNEIWKDIEGYNGRYQVSNTGKVRSFVKNPCDPVILKPCPVRGYKSVGLWDGSHSKTCLVHRLVAQAFVDNPNGYKEVNHKDENKANNNADNLEWCTRAYNMAYGTARFRQGMSLSHPVEQLSTEGIPLAFYYSVTTAARINSIDSSSILKCCKHKRSLAGGYQWRYAEFPSPQ